MKEAATNSRLLRFGIFEADLQGLELRKNGAKIKLQEQPFQVLVVLLQRPREIVTREELRQKLWPADTFVDFDHSLNTAIAKLRQALDDDAENPRFIETLPRRGYRFIASVEGLNGASASEPQSALGVELDERPSSAEPLAHGDGEPAAATVLAAKRRSIRWSQWAVTAFLLALIVAGAIWFALSRLPSGRQWAAVRIFPLNSLQGFEGGAQFSPDGTRVAFVWGGPKNENADIYVQQIGTETPLRITTFPGLDISPAWSPDGRYIAFERFGPQEGNSGIYIASSLGGSERKVYSFPHNSLSKTGLDWSPDGKFLAFVEKEDQHGPQTIFLLSIETLEKRKLTFPPQQDLGDSYPAFSPDGKTVAFLRDTLDAEEIFTVPLEGGAPKQVTFNKRVILGLAWSSDGRDIIFSTNLAGAYSLWRIPAAGGHPERLPIAGGFWANQPAVSRRGNRLAYNQTMYSSNIWRMEVSDSGVWSAPEKLIISSQLEEGPQFSPDGKRIVFQSTRTGSYEIWRCERDGSNLLQLTHFGGPLTGTPRWSPDGQQIVFDSRPEGRPHIYVISSEGGPPRAVTSGPIDDAVPAWSSDGKSIYFASSRSGTWQIWKIPASGGTAIQMTQQGGFAPQSSPDGKFIYYAKGRDERGVWRVPVDGGEESKVLDAPPGTGWGYWAVVKQGIYFADQVEHSTPGIYFFDFSNQKITKIAPFNRPPSPGAPGLGASPDGRTLLVVLTDPYTEFIMMVENFR